MTEDESLARFGLFPSAQQRQEILQVLAEQAAAERRSQGSGDTELMRLCAVQLFCAGSVEDALPIWRAKQASFDASCSLELPLLCGAGVSETMEYLSSRKEVDAQEALNALQQADWSDFSRAQELEAFQGYYFGV